ncbi:hypothetical protein L3Q82_026233 [Scortum barcoo]|uniref:Uncharacterized protein n=1 Tax=Scortum barcoo TaxID=214431 RepID=A0ACB8WIY6_9TELE|nr:hypothetical protein L3Q82_026233 [Scortum barcoo]
MSCFLFWLVSFYFEIPNSPLVSVVLLLGLLPELIVIVRSGTKMDPADANQVRSALSSQGVKLRQHEKQLSSINRGVKDLSE